MRAIYALRDKMGRGNLQCTITIESATATMTGAEQNINVISPEGQVIAIIMLGLGIDRYQTLNE